MQSLFKQESIGRRCPGICHATLNQVTWRIKPPLARWRVTSSFRARPYRGSARKACCLVVRKST